MTLSGLLLHHAQPQVIHPNENGDSAQMSEVLSGSSLNVALRTSRRELNSSKLSHIPQSSFSKRDWQTWRRRGKISLTSTSLSFA